MKWYKIKDNETLELFIVTSDIQPENSVLVTDDNSNFIKPKANDIVFTEVVEGATEKELQELKSQQLIELDKGYTKKITELVEVHVQKNILDGIPIPKEVVKERNRLKKEFYDLTVELNLL